MTYTKKKPPIPRGMALRSRQHSAFSWSNNTWCMFFLQKVFLKGTARRNGCFAKIKKIWVCILHIQLYMHVFLKMIFTHMIILKLNTFWFEIMRMFLLSTDFANKSEYEVRVCSNILVVCCQQFCWGVSCGYISPRIMEWLKQKNVARLFIHLSLKRFSKTFMN